MKPWIATANSANRTGLTPPASQRGALKPRLAGAIARRAIIVTWLCGLGALCTFVPYLPGTLMPDS